MTFFSFQLLNISSFFFVFAFLRSRDEKAEDELKQLRHDKVRHNEGGRESEELMNKKWITEYFVAHK